MPARFLLTGFWALLVLSIGPHTSAAAETTAAQPPCTAARYADFDFWAGQWQVHSPEGVLQGTNNISRQESGCLLHESWRSAGGGTGQSYNYYDPSDARWHQHWVSQGAIIRYSGGLTKSGAMHLDGEIHYQADGRSAAFRGTWTPRADGSVRQHLQEYSTRQQQWQDWFVGIYTRPTPGDPPAPD